MNKNKKISLKIEQSTEQFEISDNRDVSSFCNALRDKNLEPIFKNYDAMYRGPISYGCCIKNTLIVLICVVRSCESTPH